MNTCKTCRWYYEDVCCNGNSEHRADSQLKDEMCEGREGNE